MLATDQLSHCIERDAEMSSTRYWTPTQADVSAHTKYSTRSGARASESARPARKGCNTSSRAIGPFVFPSDDGRTVSGYGCDGELAYGSLFCAALGGLLSIWHGE